MSTYVYMRVLESAPERYDRGIAMCAGRKIADIYNAAADRVVEPATVRHTRLNMLGRRSVDVHPDVS